MQEADGALERLHTYLAKNPEHKRALEVSQPFRSRQAEHRAILMESIFKLYDAKTTSQQELQPVSQSHSATTSHSGPPPESQPPPPPPLPKPASLTSSVDVATPKGKGKKKTATSTTKGGKKAELPAQSDMIRFSARKSKQDVKFNDHYDLIYAPRTHDSKNKRPRRVGKGASNPESEDWSNELDDDCTLSYDIGDSPVYTEMSLLKKTSPLASKKQISAVTAVKNTFQSAVTSTALPPKPPTAAKKPPSPAATQVAKAGSTSLPPGWQELTCDESG